MDLSRPWNDGTEFEDFLGREAPPEIRRVANRHICNGGGGKSPLSFILPVAALALPFVGEAIAPALGALGEVGAGVGAGAGGLGEAASAATGLAESALAGNIGGAALGGLAEAAPAAAGVLGEVGSLAPVAALGATAADVVSGGGSSGGGALGSDSSISNAIAQGNTVSGAGVPETTGATAAPTGLGGGTGAGPGTTPSALTNSFGTQAPDLGVSAAPVSDGASATGSTSATLSSFGQAAPDAATATAPTGLDPSVFPSTSSIDFSVAGGPGGTLSGTGPNAVGGGIGDVLHGVGDFWKSNKDWIGAGLAGSNIVRSLLQSGNTGIDLSSLNAERQALLQRLSQQGQTLASGQLTPDQEQLLQNQLQAHLSQIDAKYGQMGMAGSTTHLQERAAAISQASASRGQQQAATMSAGLQAQGMAANVANTLVAQQLQEDEALNQMIANLARSALGGLTTTTTTTA